MGKKIAIINSVYGVGSTGRICKELSDFLKEHHFTVNTYFGRGSSKSTDNNAYKFTNRPGVYLHTFLSRFFDVSGFCSSSSTKKLIRKLEEFKPDILMVHNLHGYYINVPIFLKWAIKSNIKTLFVFHDCWNVTGHCAYFDFVKCCKWKTVCNSCPAKTNYPASFLFDKSKKHFLIKKDLFSALEKMVIITPSKWLSSIVKESFLSKKPVYVINNGIDANKFYKKDNDFRQKHGLTNKRIILCVANIFDGRKGIKDVFLLNKLISEEEQIVVVGKIKTPIKIPSNIIHIERTDSISQLVDVYSASDVFFNPTYEDTFSNVNMESLSCGTPVVCYRSGGAYEMIDEKFVVEKGDVYGAYQIIKKILQKEISYPLPEKDKFSKTKMHQKYLRVIKDLI